MNEDLSIPRLQTKSQAWDVPNEGLFMEVEEIVTEAGKHVTPGTESGSASLHGTAKTPSTKARTARPYILVWFGDISSRSVTDT